MRLLVSLMTGALILLTVPPVASLAGTDQKAAKVEAGFVYNFLKYTEWPPVGGAETNKPFVFAVVGRNGMAAALKSVLAGKTVGGRMIQLKFFVDAAALGADETPRNAIYVETTAIPEWDAIRDILADLPVLTIAETSGFCAGGGMLNLYQKESRIRFEASPGVARTRGLKLSAQLLKLATIVDVETLP